MAKNSRNTSAQQRKKRIMAKKNRQSMVMIMSVVLILCGIILYNGYKLQLRIDGFQAQAAELTEQIEEQKDRAEQLEAQAEYMKSTEYIEAVAREKLGLIYDNEIIFKKTGQ